MNIDPKLYVLPSLKYIPIIEWYITVAILGGLLSLLEAGILQHLSVK